MTRVVQYGTIAQSAQVSGVFNLENAQAATLHVPVITSASIMLQVAAVDAAADYRRLHASNGSLWTFAVAAGSLAITLGPEILGGAKFMKIESSVAQAAVRSLSMLVRL